jgi:MFS family permease
LVIIILIWAWPAYVFTLSSEYLASEEKNPTQSLRNMTKANLSITGGVVAGQILGGILMIKGSYRDVLWFALSGSILMGLILLIVSIFQHFVKKR